MRTPSQQAETAHRQNLPMFLMPACYAEVFSRYQHNDRWGCHGDEAVPRPFAEEPE